MSEDPSDAQGFQGEMPSDAKGLFDLAVTWLQAADDADDVNTTIAYTSQAECACKLARFAAEFPNVLDPFEMPGPQPDSPPPLGPTTGPQLWGVQR